MLSTFSRKVHLWIWLHYSGSSVAYSGSFRLVHNKQNCNSQWSTGYKSRPFGIWTFNLCESFQSISWPNFQWSNRDSSYYSPQQTHNRKPQKLPFCNLVNFSIFSNLANWMELWNWVGMYPGHRITCGTHFYLGPRSTLKTWLIWKEKLDYLESKSILCVTKSIRLWNSPICNSSG